MGPNKAQVGTFLSRPCNAKGMPTQSSVIVVPHHNYASMSMAIGSSKPNTKLKKYCMCKIRRMKTFRYFIE